MGCIIEVYPGQDGVVRSVKLEKKKGEFIRPSALLYLLKGVDWLYQCHTWLGRVNNSFLSSGGQFVTSENVCNTLCNCKAFFRFCSFVFNADFDTKHVQFLINKGFPKFIETSSLTLFLRLCCWLWGSYCLPTYRFHYVKSFVFYGSIIFLIQTLQVSLTLFWSFKSNSLSVTVVQKRCVKESLGQSQDCYNLVLVKVNSSTQIVS